MTLNEGFPEELPPLSWTLTQEQINALGHMKEILDCKYDPKLIQEHELSRYAICKAAAVDPGQMHRFIKGTGRLTTDSLDRIGSVLNLQLVIGK